MFTPVGGAGEDLQDDNLVKLLQHIGYFLILKMMVVSTIFIIINGILNCCYCGLWLQTN